VVASWLDERDVLSASGVGGRDVSSQHGRED
jgi:hypothetical protein